jgi:16S rRNA (guanine527-N7)-methyltransferase
MEKLKWDAQTLLGIRLSTRQIEALERYENELISWNSRFNLTAIRDSESIRVKHFLDSLSCLLAMRDAPPSRLVDVGTGAGFPGLPLKIVVPTMRLTLVESVGKKVEFCRHIVDMLGLEGVDVFHARAEEIAHMRGQRGLYDWAIARAVASLPVLLEYLLPFVRIGGRVLAQKGESGPTEAQASERALRLLGGQVHQLIPVHLPGVAEDRYLIVIQKTAATPDHYPRRPGLPSRSPLI